MGSLIRDSIELEEFLSRPQEATIDAVSDIQGDFILLGAGGKMGTTLARMARRAADAAGQNKRVIAVSRFSDSKAQSALHDSGIETQQGNLLDPRFVESLPECDNVIYMVGQKFGTSSSPGATWVTNSFIPGLVCHKFSKSRIVCFSTGNVYPMVSVESGGSKESDELLPNGEYAMSALARERVLQYFSEALDISAVILRLNYATELRYGILVDLAKKVMQEEAISLSMGYFNCIWQGDANNLTLRSLAIAGSPARILNLTGIDIICSRDVCGLFGDLLRKTVHFKDSEEPTALLSDASATSELLGPPQVTLEEMVAWTTQWLINKGETWNIPTHFEVRDGKY